MKELIKHIETGALDGRITGNEVQIILRALRLLDVIDGAAGETPETDAAQIYLWQNDETCRTCWRKDQPGTNWYRVGVPALCHLDDASRLERERNGLAARVAELERAESAIAAAERKIERLKFHAEAMAEHMVKAIVVVGWPEEQSYGDEWSHDADCIVAAYRADRGE